MLQIKKARVAVVRGSKPSRMVGTVLKLLEVEREFPPGNVVVKPNYVFAKPPDSGITTDPRIVEELVKFVKKSGSTPIIAEGGAGDTERAFDVVGIRGVAQRQSVGLINLNAEPRIKMSITDGMALRDVGLSMTALNCGSIINVPKLKMHSTAFVTLSMKNLMGFILPKSIMHSRIDEKIVDLAGLLKGKVRLNVVDGLVGAERDEGHGDPVRMDLVIAGRDMVAVDAVGAAVMGVDPTTVGYLRLAGSKGLGISRLSDIEVLGEQVEDVAKDFARPGRFARL